MSHPFIFVSDFEEEFDFADAIFVFVVKLNSTQPTQEFTDVFLFLRLVFRGEFGYVFHFGPLRFCVGAIIPERKLFVWRESFETVDCYERFLRGDYKIIRE